MTDKDEIKTAWEYFLKISGYVTLALGIMMLMILGFGGSDAEAKGKYHFRYPCWEAAGAYHTENFYLWWPRRVEELSKGEVTFDLFPGQVLMKGFNHYEAVRDNTVGFAPTVSGYEADTLPLGTFAEFPFLLEDLGADGYRKYFKMRDEMLAAGLQSYYNKKGVYNIAGTQVTPNGVWTTKKWGPVRKLDDLKGCKIRTPGGLLNNALVAMGAQPVTLAVADTYMSLQTGVIDGASLAEPASLSIRLQEVIKYATRLNYGSVEITIIGNLETWNKLPQHIRDIMLQAGREVQEHFAKQQKIEWEKTADLLKKAGVEVIYLDKNEQARLRQVTKPIKAQWEVKYGNEEQGLGNKLLKIIDKYSVNK